MVGTDLTAHEIDDVLAGTFPAGDPPAWTSGIARPAPALTAPSTDTSPPDADVDATGASGMGEERDATSAVPALGPALVSVMGSENLALLLPVAFLVIGVSVPFALRGLLGGPYWIPKIIR